MKRNKTREVHLLDSKNATRLAAIVVLLALVYWGGIGDHYRSAPPRSHPVENSGTSDARLATAFENHERNVRVEGVGHVVRILREDDDGIRHQKFILELASGQKILIAHNIDVAGRVEPLRVGDTVEFRGEYEWNSQGGVVHWTHHDPEGRHADGWLKHDGRIFQ